MSLLVTKELTQAEARQLTDKIRTSLDELIPLIIEAFHGCADRALGYESWELYCKAELFSISIPVGNREQRREVVGRLRASGMSTRGIGAAVGYTHRTVLKDIGVLAATGDKSPVETIIGINRKRYNPDTNGNYVKEPEFAACSPVYAEIIPTPFEWYKNKITEYITEIHNQHDLTPTQAQALAEVADAVERFANTA